MTAPDWKRHRAAATRHTLAVEQEAKALRRRMAAEGRLTAEDRQQIATIIRAALDAEAHVDAIQAPEVAEVTA